MTTFIRYAVIGFTAMMLWSGAARSQFAVIDAIDLPFDLLNQIQTSASLAELIEMVEKAREIYEKAEEIKEMTEDVRGTLQRFRPEALFNHGSYEREVVRRYAPALLRDFDLAFNWGLNFTGQGYQAPNDTVRRLVDRGLWLLGDYDLEHNRTVDRYTGGLTDPNWNRLADADWQHIARAAGAAVVAEASYERTEARLGTMEALLNRIRSSSDAKTSMDLLVRGQGHVAEIQAEQARLSSLLLQLRSRQRLQEKSAEARVGRVLRFDSATAAIQ